MAAMSPLANQPASPPRFLDQVRQAALDHFQRSEPAERCVAWWRRFILYHKKRHPAQMGIVEVGAFLKHVAATMIVPRIVDELHNAREALAFVYEHVLHRPLGEIALPEPPRLLDRMRQALRVRHYSPRTEQCYVEWAGEIKRTGLVLISERAEDARPPGSVHNKHSQVAPPVLHVSYVYK